MANKKTKTTSIAAGVVDTPIENAVAETQVVAEVAAPIVDDNAATGATATGLEVPKKKRASPKKKTEGVEATGAGIDAGCGCAGVVASGATVPKKKVTPKKQPKKEGETEEERVSRLKSYKRDYRKQRAAVIANPETKTSTGLGAEQLVAYTDKNGRQKVVSRAKLLLSAKCAPWVWCSAKIREEMGLKGFHTLSSENEGTAELTRRTRELHDSIKGTKQAADIEAAKRAECEAIIAKHDAAMASRASK